MDVLLKDRSILDLLHESNNIFRHLDDILPVNIPNFEIYPTELSKSNNNSTCTPLFLDLDIIHYKLQPSY